MSKKFFILLEEFSRKPAAEIGQISKSISKLVSVGIPVPKAICIPSSTLKVIAKANKLDAKAHKLIQETNLDSTLSKNRTIEKLKKLIDTQKIPADLSREFLKLYHTDLHASFVSIQNSTTVGNRDILVQNIKGDVNVIDVFLEVWAKTVEQSFRKFSEKTKDLDKILFPSPILIQQQIDAEMSGSALTFDEQDGSKKRFTIKGVWGITNKNLSEADTYIVDSRTFQLIQKSLRKQVSQYIRNLEKLRKIKLGENKKYNSVLTASQAKELAKIISKIGRQSISQLEIEWGLQNNVFFIHGIKETEFLGRVRKPKKSIKKIYVSVNNIKDSKAVEKHGDGICILNSGKLLSSLKEHPAHIAKTSKKKILIEAIVKSISKYLSVKPDLHLIYRSQNLGSGDLSKLKNSSNYEVKEANPHLGLRGASKILAQPQVFNLELSIIKKLVKETQGKISLLIPFVRSPSEISQVIKLVEKSGLKNNDNFDIWLELSTPENVLNITDYPLNKLGGVVFNARSIYSLVHGFDLNNDEILSRHRSNDSLIVAFIKNTAKSLRQFSRTKSLIKNHKLLVNLTNYNSGIIKDVISEDISGIIIDPKLTEVAKKCIINEEGKIIT